jgi:hypothetical protein
MLSVALLITGFLFLFIVKRDYSDFYQEYHRILWISVSFLTIPPILRCFFDWLQTFPNYYAWIHSGSSSITTYNLLFFVFTTYILILSQGATLLFGLVRYRQKIEFRENKKQLKLSLNRESSTTEGSFIN